MPVGVDQLQTTALADVQANFKRAYTKAVDSIPDSNPLSSQFSRTKKFKAGPDGIYFKPKLETGGKVANVPDGKQLPLPSGPRHVQGKVMVAHTYSVVGMGGQGIPLTEDTRNAFVSMLEDQMEDCLQRLKTDVERQYNNNGTGILTVLSAVGGAPTYTTNKPGNVVGGGPGTMYLIEGMEIACINPSGGAERSRATIVSIDVANETFTTDAALTNAAIGDFIVRCNDVSATGNNKANNYGAEAAGIGAVCASGDTFENINGAAAGNRRWNGNPLLNGGTTRGITERLVTQLIALVRTKSGRKPTLHYTSAGVSLALQEQLAGRIRTDYSVKMKGGYEGLNIAGNTVIEGDLCPKGRWYALNTDEDVAGTMDLVPMGYIDLDGAELHRVEGFHAYRADLWFPHNLIWFQRNAQGFLGDLIDDNTLIR